MPNTRTTGGGVTRRAFKISEVAAQLGVSPLSIRRAINRGQIIPCRVFRHVLIPADQVDELLRLKG